MKTALITTTINVPHVLRLYRALDADVRFFVAGDLHNKNTLAIEQFFDDFPNAVHLGAETQRHLGYECSEPIGWNSIQRRNIATLEALRWGADLIVSIDDDNAPIGLDYFEKFSFVLTGPFYGLAATPKVTNWWSAYHQVPHRGFPTTEVIDVGFAPVTDLRVGVAEGLCLGDPDVDAYTRMSRKSEAWATGEVTRNGYVVLPTEPWTTFNSQNTAFVRALAPAMFMLPGVGRYDDIFASLICQRVMRQHGYVTHFGPPFVWQQRNAHNLINDLKAEIFGMEHVVEFAEWLDGLCISSSVLGDVRYIYTAMSDLKWMPAQVREAGLAWCDDVGCVL